MSKFNKINTGIEGLYIIEPTVFGDNRGFFLESYSKKEFEEIGLTYEFVQDNHSKSKKGVLRGLHFQTKHSQGKLVRVIKGAVYDVAVDIRKGSKTYGKWYGIELSAENKKMFFIPPGFAHGFLTLEDETEFQYKCTDIYAPQYDSGIMWNDKDLNIDWKLEEYNIDNLIFSEKDKKHQSFKEYTEGYQKDYVLITGANGQLGKDFLKLFDKKGIKYQATDYENLDITDRDKVRDYILNNNFTVVINCAAYNNVDKAEGEKDKCYALNFMAVKNLTDVCKEKNIIFMTYSTDFVFDGKNSIPYTEEDVPNPLSVYSKSKYDGERYALQYSKTYLVRTSWVFGMGNNNFCKQVINWSRKNKVLKIVDDQISVPTYSKDLAEFSWELLLTDEYGLYHFSNRGEASKFNQAKYILNKIGWNGKLQRAKTQDFNLDAERPTYSKLDSYKIENILHSKIPHWKEAIDRFLEEMVVEGEI